MVKHDVDERALLMNLIIKELDIKFCLSGSTGILLNAPSGPNVYLHLFKKLSGMSGDVLKESFFDKNAPLRNLLDATTKMMLLSSILAVYNEKSKHEELDQDFYPPNIKRELRKYLQSPFGQMLLDDSEMQASIYLDFDIFSENGRLFSGIKIPGVASVSKRRIGQEESLLVSSLGILTAGNGCSLKFMLFHAIAKTELIPESLRVLSRISCKEDRTESELSLHNAICDNTPVQLISELLTGKTEEARLIRELSGISDSTLLLAFAARSLDDPCSENRLPLCMEEFIWRITGISAILKELSSLPYDKFASTLGSMTATITSDEHLSLDHANELSIEEDFFRRTIAVAGFEDFKDVKFRLNLSNFYDVAELSFHSLVHFPKETAAYLSFMLKLYRQLGILAELKRFILNNSSKGCRSNCSWLLSIAALSGDVETLEYISGFFSKSDLAKSFEVSKALVMKSVGTTFRNWKLSDHRPEPLCPLYIAMRANNFEAVNWIIKRFPQRKKSIKCVVTTAAASFNMFGQSFEKSQYERLYE